MDHEHGYPNAKPSKGSTAPMMFYPHAPLLPTPRGPAPSTSPAQRPPPNQPGTPLSSPLRVISPTPLSGTYSASITSTGSDLEHNDSDLCTHHSNTLPVYCFDCDLTHSPGECDGVFGLSKRSGLWVWFVMKWIRRMVGVKSGRVAGEDSAFVQIVGAREAGYRWAGGGGGARGAMRR